MTAAHSLAPVAVKEGTGGTLRTRPSSETIRPKKEKKRPSRKQPNIGSGTASSKADIFEAKIASAVDEADSSDSEETFVYDSNPPDNNDRPRRFHSRTPSATSMISQVDRNGLRSITNIMDNAASNAGTKRNMKFVNTFNSSGNESAMAEDDGKGTARSAAGFASCLVLTVMLLLVVSGAIGFMFATSQPLTDVELIAIKSVVAAEQELIFDIEVKAHNPNVVVVSIDQADIEVFAKSPHAGTEGGWQRPDDHQGSDSRWYSNNGNVHAGEEFDGPIDEKAPNMRLGTIGQLDSPLSFEGSFFNHGYSDSTGEVRLRGPGNGTVGGTERWERILQDEFDLIVKGVLKYSLPLSQHVRSATISGRTTIKPNAANDPTGNRTEPITEPKKPE
ncbi:putative phospholipid metabolism enzyme regulator [Diaporthe ampelina]|uniref:Putative phospholipid metabolism enzyme regulator n=1 Tax=Diaporthe ampelina TaxID=1214573 RepID=A0A0G2FHU4_9PEZI|nr:putative phospholipid metabolism enzyme regulator [Diaporthe ampelina]